MADKRWSDKEVAYLIKRYHRMSIREIAKHLDKSHGAVYEKITKLQLKRDSGGRPQSVKSYIANMKEIDIETQVDNKMLIDKYMNVEDE